MKLPIRRLAGTVPPQFEYYQTVSLPQGGVQTVKHIGCVSPSMEAALCDTLSIAEQLAAENERLKSSVRKK